MAHNPVVLLARALRREGLTVNIAAAELGISGASLSRILGGKQVPRSGLQGRIEKRFDVAPSLWPADHRARHALTRALRRATAATLHGRRREAPALAATGTEG